MNVDMGAACYTACMEENQMVPSNWQINFQFQKNVCRYIIGQDEDNKIEYHRWDSHPDWDCQPWSESYANRTTLVTHAYHTELETTRSINSKFLQVTLWSEHPNVFRYPQRKK